MMSVADYVIIGLFIVLYLAQPFLLGLAIGYDIGKKHEEKENKK